jgi:hypothetical protein
LVAVRQANPSAFAHIVYAQIEEGGIQGFDAARSVSSGYLE